MWVKITQNWQCFHQDEEYVFVPVLKQTAIRRADEK